MAINLNQEQLKQLVQEAVAAALAAATATTTSTTVDFHVVPGGDETKTDPWNLTGKEGLNFFQAATKGIYPKFDGDPERLPYFLDQIQDRAEEYGFSAVLLIKLTTTDIRKLTTEYGSITEEQVITHAKTYLDKENRLRQGSRMIVSLLKNSLDLELLDELKTKDYKIEVKINGADKKLEDGALMLYQFINLVSVNTRSTVAGILKTLTGTGLTLIIEEVKSDIKKFNKKVNLLMISLRARRKEVPDIIPALFEAYASVSDTKFVEYIGRKEEEYEDGELPDMTNSTLMHLAGEKYKTLVEKKAWGKKTKEELEFIALKAELEDAKKRLTMKKEKKDDKDKEKDKKGPRNDGIWQWKTIAPKPGEPHEKKFRGRDYIHCPHHGDTKWVLKVNAQGIEHETGCREKQKYENEQMRKTNAIVMAAKAAKAAASDSNSTATSSTSSSTTTRDDVIAKALATVLGDNLGDVSVLTEDEDIAAPRVKS